MVMSLFKKVYNCSCTIRRLCSGAGSVTKNPIILGIETSCDDTGSALIDGQGNILSETLQSQNLIHLRNGGIIPDVAQDLHRNCIQQNINETLLKAKMSWNDVSAIAVTVEPGLPLSLAVGVKYAKHLASKHKIPLIPIHHMEAHALVARMNHQIQFPFLTLLLSGGHCLLATVHDVKSFKLLGQSMDSAPGEMFDKVARRMKLKNVPEYSEICGGRAIELAASKATNSSIFKLPLPLTTYKDCNFSFNGLKTSVLLHLHRKEREHQIVANKIIPEINDLCAALLMATAKHIVHRTQRAMEYCQLTNLIPNNNKQLVVSGGVACNNFIFNALKLLCHEFNYNFYRPAPALCTDNGIMIAWNGLEKFRKGLDVIMDYKTIDLEAISPLGENIIEDVNNANIATKLVKIKMQHVI